MASYKSHYNPPKRTEDQTPYSHRTPTTRLPQRSITPIATSSQAPAPGPSKLQKRRPLRDEVHPTTGVTGQRVPTPKALATIGLRQGSATSTVPIIRSTAPPTGSKVASQSSSSRLPKLEVPPTNTRTPSLVSGSSASTVDSPRSNLLRRKQTSIGVGSRRQERQTREDSMSSQDEKNVATGIPGGYKDPFSETVLGISLPPTSTIFAHSEAELELSEYSHRELELGPTDILPPPPPHYALTTTPSTRYSESPGPFSVSSTPNSMSSYSPGVAMSTKTTVRTRQVSPLQGRPPVVRYRTPEERALPSVRKFTTSSSSSTVRVDTGRIREKSQIERLHAPPPSPPPKTTQIRPATSHRQPEVEKSGVNRGLRRSSETREDKPKVQTPPELAHLVDQASSTMAPRRPARPSRDGAPEITGFRGPSPIIQSNMMNFPSSHKRTTSTDSTASAAMNSRTRFGLPSKQSSRNASPNPSLTSGFAPPSRVPARGPTPDLQLEKQRSQTLPTPAPTPSPSKTSRFGFFSRRTKTDPGAPVTKPEKKPHRRGPAAGTGHEGYGRYVVRARNGSAASGSSIGKSPSAATTTESLDRTPSTRKSSVTSMTSTEIDDFFLERLNPVVIRGTGSSTELTRSPDPLQSTSSLDVSSPRLSHLKTTTNNSSKSDLESTHPALLPSAMSDSVHSISLVKKMSLGLGRPSESEDEMKKSFIPSLSTRRASRTSNLVDTTPSAKKEPSKVRKGSIGGVISEGKEGNWLKSSKKEKTERESSKPSRKWNFFQRAQGAPHVPTPTVVASSSPARAPMSRSVAHYAIVDTQSGLDTEDIEQLMQEADSTPEEGIAPEEPDDSEVPEPEHAPMEKERLPSMLLPPKPVLPDDFSPPSRPGSPKVFLRPMPEFQPKLTLDTSVTEQATHAPLSVADLTPVTDLSPTSSPLHPSSPVQPFGSVASLQSIPAPVFLPSTHAALSPLGPPPSNSPPRPSRLAQVGRIPQVVSSRNTAHRPPSRSFSRPFTANQPGSTAPPRTSFDSIGSMTAIAGPVEPYPILHGLNALTHGSAIATMSPSAEESHRQGEFFIFPSRKGSEVSYSSSSGTWSFPVTAGTAIVPVRGTPTSEDEVWNEYDDLIDEVLSPIDDSQSTLSAEAVQKRPSLEPLPLRPKHSRASPHSAASATAVSNPSLHLRRSRLLAVLHSQSPTSSVSLSEFLQEYGERSINVVDPLTGRLSFPSTAHMSIGSGPLDRASSNRSSLPASLNLSSRQSKATLASISDKHRSNSSVNRYRDTRLIEMAETQADGLSTMANLRFGALMTSKWLSFGRVIFSPAHFELKNPEHDRVLVIDGLGKDWSYYCALTYPEATVYNLGPGQATLATTTSNAPEPWSTLKNHRHSNQTSLGDPFPFPKGFFACVVLRFPSALPTSVHRFVISECKRVLRPGGYLELSVLDLDLINMGNRARRAVRGLKVKMQAADEDISLRNISDEIMGLVGRKGFTECNRCFVGVPVAGALPKPDDPDTATSKKRKGSTASSIHRTSNTTVKGKKQPKPEVSFSDLLNTRASSESTDNTITDMVARVGRWWYSRCYESLVLPEAGEPDVPNSGNLLQNSLWRDEALITECEKRGTSFRLLIGYAQKPEVGVRRTVSV